MKTKYLNNEIELLNSIKRNNELSDYGKEKLNEFNKIKEQLILSGVVGQSEQLKPMVFKLANKLAIAGHGDAAVSMHRIHNKL
tara:strand:+ start:331 stop:579 length:249 start_codon:yes stop_codon:yes gene_type:complete